MNQKELRELRRRFRPEHNNIREIYGCYVNSAGEIVSSFEESMGLLGQNEREKYLALLKKTLSGALGKNLLDVAFETRQVAEGEEHKLLAALRRTELRDAALREAFFQSVIGALDRDAGNALILLACDVYDVPHYGKDGQRDGEPGEQYRYLVCAVCPVKDGKAALGYVPEEKRFQSAAAGQLVGAPELGFLYPAFDDRAANIYNALFYTRDLSDDHKAFVEAVFRADAPLPAGQEKALFGELLSETFAQHCPFELVQSVHEQLAERLSLHKESKDPETLTLSGEELGEILLNSGAQPEQAEAFRRHCRESLGEDAQLRPGNLSGTSRMEIKTPEVKISVAPQYSHLIETRVLDGRRYLLIAADAGVELNGVPVEISVEGE